ncbi:Tetratricopeptide repeat protein 16 [Nowakowskiella sp. JEL0407]|nr:Tetratricopeptide repeat protein 16 [Nowakowskiella sp. JEL0407]
MESPFPQTFEEAREEFEADGKEATVAERECRGSAGEVQAVSLLREGSWMGLGVVTCAESRRAVLGVFLLRSIYSQMAEVYSTNASCIATLSRVISLSNDTAAFYNRAELFLEITDFSAAYANFHRAYFLASGVSLSFTCTESSSSASSNLGRFIKWRLAYACLFHSQILIDQHRFSEAVHYLICAKNLKIPKSPQILLLMTISLFALNQIDAAIETVSELLRVNKNKSAIPDFLIMRAKLYRMNNQTDFSNVDLDSCRKLRPNHPELEKLMKFVICESVQLKNYAAKSILKGNVTDAIMFLNYAVELDNLDWSSFLKRGVLFAGQGQFESALNDLEMVLSIEFRDKSRDPEVNAIIGSIYNQLGVETFQQKKTHTAISMLSEAINRNPKEPIIWKNRAECYLSLKDTQSSLNDLLESIKLDPSDEISKSRVSEIYQDKAQKLLSQGQYSDALEAYSTAKEYDPENADTFFGRAKCYYLLKDINKSRDELEKALMSDESHTEARFLWSQLETRPECLKAWGKRNCEKR